MHMKMISSLFCILVWFAAGRANGQGKTDRELQAYPYWIEMMSDTGANFYETVKAFDLYWQNRELPIEEEQLMGERLKSERHNFFTRLRLRLRGDDDTQLLAFEYKKFNWWRMQNELWVKQDGFLYTPEERKQILAKERETAK